MWYNLMRSCLQVVSFLGVYGTWGTWKTYACQYNIAHRHMNNSLDKLELHGWECDTISCAHVCKLSLFLGYTVRSLLLSSATVFVNTGSRMLMKVNRFLPLKKIQVDPKTSSKAAASPKCGWWVDLKDSSKATQNVKWVAEMCYFSFCDQLTANQARHHSHYLRPTWS